MKWMLAVLYFVIVIILLLLYPLAKAYAQERHHLHHANYQSWVNKAGRGCCNNQDCGELLPENERTTATGVEVKIDGAWCPVQSFHYLKSGNAPDWSTAHVCIQKYSSTAQSSPCERLLCYQPKPLF